MLAAGGAVVCWDSGRLSELACGDPDACTPGGCVTLDVMGGPVPWVCGTGGGGAGGPVPNPDGTGVAPACSCAIICNCSRDLTWGINDGMRGGLGEFVMKGCW